MHLLVHRCSETWAMSGWGIDENPAPAAQQLLLVFWEAMPSNCNMLIAYRLRNIKVRFRIRLRLELGTIIDVVLRERTGSATKILLKIHTCIFILIMAMANFFIFLLSGMPQIGHDTICAFVDYYMSSMFGLWGFAMLKDVAVLSVSVFQLIRNSMKGYEFLFK